MTTTHGGIGLKRTLRREIGGIAFSCPTNGAAKEIFLFHHRALVAVAWCTVAVL